MSKPIARRSTENQGGGEWQECPAGLFRWLLGKPELVKSTMYDNWNVQFPLSLTEPERDRLKEEFENPPEGTLQSWRPAFGGYRTGLSFGFIQKDGSYKTTKMVDFLVCCFGHKNVARARKYFETGGGPALTEDMSEEDQIALVNRWLEHFDNLEILGSITHAPGKQGGILARFGGPMAVGAPGTLWGADPDYQVSGLGKLRAIVADDQAAAEPAPATVDEAVTAGAATAAKYTSEGEEIAPVAAGARVAANPGEKAAQPTYDSIFGSDEDSD